MIKTILIQIALHAAVLLVAGLVHEFGHRYSLKILNWQFKKKPYRTIISEYEYMTQSGKMHMYWFGILWGAVVVFALQPIAPIAPSMYFIGCKTDIKELWELSKRMDK